LGVFSVMWSEHCSYKSSRVYLKNLPTEGPYVLQGPGENAGVVDIGDGLAVAFKMESHNHPSFIEPYQGAATGVGGILRDIFTMGARPIASLNSLRFGAIDHPRTGYLLAGVVAGIGGYGNCIGVPTVGGECYFDECYNANILVNAFTLGIVKKKNIFIGEGAKIKPGVVLDAEGGPIYIGKNVTVFPNAVIEGPAFVGNNSSIKIGAKIYENTSIGEVCKVGGEVEDSIIHSYSNKQHDGFLGHSYLGMWVNLGADTNNSDLKNNYGNVRVTINGEQVDSGSMFVGLTMGDHSKSAINTMFNSGTIVGVSSNIFGAGFHHKYIPSFSWGGSETMETYDVERSIDVAKRVMARRKIEMTGAEEKLFRTIFDLTKEERKKWISSD